MPKKKIPIGPREIFKRFVPEKAVEFCLEKFTSLKFEFRVTKPRNTKLGDFRHDFSTGKNTITINSNLQPYSFLITYIHEVAHLVTLNKYGREVPHHGKEWKKEYRDLLLESLTTNTFPAPLENEILRFSNNPKASTAASANLMKVLKQFEKSDSLYLSDIELNQKFIFQNYEYIKIEKKRTRSLCVRIIDKKKFLISEIAEVKL